MVPYLTLVIFLSFEVTLTIKILLVLEETVNETVKLETLPLEEVLLTKIGCANKNVVIKKKKTVIVYLAPCFINLPQIKMYSVVHKYEKTHSKMNFYLRTASQTRRTAPTDDERK